MATEPRPLDDLILLHVNDEALDMDAPSWARHEAIYSLADIAAWVEAEPAKRWTVLPIGSVQMHTGVGDLPIYKLILA